MSDVGVFKLEYLVGPGQGREELWFRTLGFLETLGGCYF